MEKEENSVKPIKVGEWVWTILLTFVPVVGLIMLFVWAFDNSQNPIKANWAKGCLICILIGVVFWIMFGGALLGGFYNMFSTF